MEASAMCHSIEKAMMTLPSSRMIRKRRLGSTRVTTVSISMRSLEKVEVSWPLSVCCKTSSESFWVLAKSFSRSQAMARAAAIEE